MTSNERVYLGFLRRVREEGRMRTDRTGVGTIGVFGGQMRFRLDGGAGGIPLLTTKRMAWKSCIHELLWFLRGDTDARVLQRAGVPIWDGNTSRAFLDSRGLGHLPEGDIGAGYGFQWRHAGAEYRTCEDTYTGEGVDQIAEIERLLREDPFSRRIVLCAWNVRDLGRMALPPCHVLAQFYVDEAGAGAGAGAGAPAGKRTLSCHMYQRSCDMFLGIPFNIFSYACLTSLLAARAGMEPGDLVISMGDAHIYQNHLDAVDEQLARDPLPAPRLVLSERARDPNTRWEDLDIGDFVLDAYQCHPAIRAPMAV